MNKTVEEKLPIQILTYFDGLLKIRGVELKYDYETICQFRAYFVYRYFK